MCKDTLSINFVMYNSISKEKEGEEHYHNYPNLNQDIKN